MRGFADKAEYFCRRCGVLPDIAHGGDAFPVLLLAAALLSHVRHARGILPDATTFHGAQYCARKGGGIDLSINREAVLTE